MTENLRLVDETVLGDFIKPYVIRQPKLVSVSFIAVYDTGAVQFGAVVSDGSNKPLTVEFKNSKGSSSTL